MRTGLPSGLQTLLNFLGLKGGQDAQGQGTGVEKSAMQALGKDGKSLIEKGAVLGEEAQLLAGLGYNPADKQSAAKNIAEKANVERFMHDVATEREKPLPLNDKKDGDAFTPDKNDRAGTEERLDRDGAETKQVRDEQRGDDRLDEGRAQVMQEAKQEKEQREVKETKEQEKQQERNRDEGQQDDREKHGTPWVPEELEREEEKKRRRGIRLDDALGAESRCHGLLEDGGRCLRRPIPGTPYCREHVNGRS